MFYNSHDVSTMLDDEKQAFEHFFDFTEFDLEIFLLDFERHEWNMFIVKSYFYVLFIR